MRTFFLGVNLLAPAVAQSPLQATLIAVAPVEAEWVNAPPGTAGALMSQPAGPLTSVDLTAPVGQNWAHVTCALSANGSGWRLEASSQVFSPPGEIAETRVDLLLLLTAIAPTTLALDLQLAHWGDFPFGVGFRIDLGDDGSDELDTTVPYCCGSVRRQSMTRTIDATGLAIRIRGVNTMWVSPQAYDLWIDAQPWLPQASAVAADCGRLGIEAPLPVWYGGNYQLAALSSSDPAEFGVLRATGLGGFDLFFVAGLPTTAPLVLPPPLPGPCDLLTDILVAVPGTPTVPGSTATEWELRLPLLPPGLALFVQHASVHTIAPFGFGTTNVLRLDT
jgi:hypothetical protein